MIGNQIDLYFHGGPQPTIGAAITIIMSLFLVILMGYYMWSIHRGPEGGADAMTDAAVEQQAAAPRAAAARACGSAPRAGSSTRGAGRASCRSITWLYMAWAIVPVLIAIQFSFNDSRSRTVWAGFSTKWYYGDQFNSVWHNDQLRSALYQSLKLAGADVLIATPIGVALALGPRPLARPRLGPVQLPDAVPAGDPRDRHGRVAAVGVHAPVHVHPHQHARPDPRARDLLDLLRGGDRARPVVLDRQVVRGSRGRPGRDATRGAPEGAASRCFCRPIVSSAAIVFAISIDDFVISYYLSCGARLRHGADRDLQRHPRSAAAEHQRDRHHHGRRSRCRRCVAGFMVYRIFTRGEAKTRHRRGRRPGRIRHVGIPSVGWRHYGRRSQNR